MKIGGKKTFSRTSVRALASTLPTPQNRVVRTHPTFRALRTADPPGGGVPASNWEPANSLVPTLDPLPIEPHELRRGAEEARPPWLVPPMAGGWTPLFRAGGGQG